MTTTDVVPVAPEQLRKLRRLNVIAGFAHLIQMIAVLVLSNEFALSVTGTYMTGPPGSPFAPPVTIFDVRIGWGVALFFGLSALFHFQAPGSSRATPTDSLTSTTTSAGSSTR